MTFDAGVAKAQDVSRDANGNVELTGAGTTTATGKTTGTVVTATVSETERVMYDRMKAGITTGSADLTLKRNGNSITSLTGVTPGQSLVTAGTPRTSVSKWTVSANWNTGIQSNTYSAGTYTEILAIGGTTTTKSVTKTVSGVGSKVYATATFNLANDDGTYGAGTAFISVNNNRISSAYLSTLSATRIAATTSGSFSTPSVTWGWHAASIDEVNGIDLTMFIGPKYANVYSAGKATATVSKNKVTTVS